MNLRQAPRVPANCPPNFQRRYTVVPGDTFFIIARRFQTNVSALIAANPHIPNPNIIFPGDVLCVPGQAPFLCCIILNPVRQVPAGTLGAALVHTGPTGNQQVNVVATLPPPSTFGNFNVWLAEAMIPDVGGFGNQLFPTPETPPTYATTIEIPPAASLTADSSVIVCPFRTGTGISGPTVLSGSLRSC